MKTIEMNIVETKINGTTEIVKTYVRLEVDYKAGWGLPMHANKEIISAKTIEVNVFEIGDTVTCEVKRNSSEDEDGQVSGGQWITKIGIVESVYTLGLSGFVKFDDGGGQIMSLIQGDGGYPGRNIQPIQITSNTNIIELKNARAIDENTVKITYIEVISSVEFTVEMSSICAATGETINFYLTVDVECSNEQLNQLVTQTIIDSDENSTLYIELRDTFDYLDAADLQTLVAK